MTVISRIDEELIKYAWPQDVWFHVDKLSSAHVYLRMPDAMTWDAIPEALLTDLAQLVKANSIEGLQFHSFFLIIEINLGPAGNKKDDLTIIYTPADNLKVCDVSICVLVHTELSTENRRHGSRPSLISQ